MKTKIIGFFICMLMIAPTIPAIGTLNNDQINKNIEPSSMTTVIWSETFDSYAAGSPIHGQGGWECWDLNTNLTPHISDIQSHSAPNSLELNWSTGYFSDIVHLFYGIDSGQWTITAWWFLPENFTGCSAFILLNKYEHKEVHEFPDDWSLTLIADRDENIIYHLEGAGESLPLIKNKWVEIRCEIDFDLDTFDVYYNNTILGSFSWTDGNGEKNLACIDLANDAEFSTATYFDDITIEGEIGTESDLECYGELDFGTIKPGETVTCSFIVQNQGISLLDWEIVEYPEWGESWSFDPNSGTDLGPYDPVTVTVEVTAPDEKDKFTGEVKIVNTENPDDYEIISVALSTPKSTPFIYNFPILSWLCESFPNAFPLLKLIFGF